MILIIYTKCKSNLIHYDAIKVKEIYNWFKLKQNIRYLVMNNLYKKDVNIKLFNKFNQKKF